MFFSKRAFNALSSSARCSGDKSFLLLLMFRALVALIVVASRVSYLLFRCAPPHGVFSACLCILTIRSFRAVRSAPVSTSSLAAARRICVCPIFPPPPGIGKKISGASSTNAACSSSVSIRFPYPLLARPPKQISCLLHEKPAILRGSTLPPSRLGQSCESLLRSSGDSVDYGVSDHLGRHMSTAPGRIMGKPSVKALRKRLSGRVADDLPKMSFRSQGQWHRHP